MRRQRERGRRAPAPGAIRTSSVLALHRIAGDHQRDTLLRPAAEPFRRERHPTTPYLFPFLVGQLLERLLVQFQGFDLWGLARFAHGVSPLSAALDWADKRQYPRRPSRQRTRREARSVTRP